MPRMHAFALALITAILLGGCSSTSKVDSTDRPEKVGVRAYSAVAPAEAVLSVERAVVEVLRGKGIEAQGINAVSDPTPLSNVIVVTVSIPEWEKHVSNGIVLSEPFRPRKFYRSSVSLEATKSGELLYSESNYKIRPGEGSGTRVATEVARDLTEDFAKRFAPPR